MMRALRRVRLGVWITLILATGSVGSILFFFLPRQKEIMHAHSEMNQKRKFVVETTRLLATIELAEQQLEKAKAQVERFGDSTVSGGKLADLYAAISEKAALAKTAIIRFSPSTTVEMGKIQRLPVSIACRGSFQGLSAFLLELENLPQTVWIDNLRISPNEGVGADLQCEFTLTIFVEGSDFSGSTIG